MTKKSRGLVDTINKLLRKWRATLDTAFLDTGLMLEAPLYGTTLVGLGQVRKDHATIFDMPLPSSLSGDAIHRSMLVTSSVVFSR